MYVINVRYKCNYNKIFDSKLTLSDNFALLMLDALQIDQSLFKRPKHFSGFLGQPRHLKRAFFVRACT